jgi:hypothetical protein
MPLVEITAKVSRNNLAQFRPMVEAAIATINRNLVTDEDFGQAENDSKKLKQIEENVHTAKERALAAARDVRELFAALDETNEMVRMARLDLDRQIAKRKEEVRAELLFSAMESLDCTPHNRHDFSRSLAEAMKGKKTLESIKRALAATVDVHNALIHRSRARITAHIAQHGGSLVMDRDDLEIKTPDVVETELRRRVEARQAEIERKRLQDEAARAKSDAQAAIQGPAGERVLPDQPRPQCPDGPSGIAFTMQGRAEPQPQPAWDAASSTVHPDAADEWESFANTFKSALLPIRAARTLLRHEVNKQRATLLAKYVNDGWTAANGKGIAR